MRRLLDPSRRLLLPLLAGLLLSACGSDLIYRSADPQSIKPDDPVFAGSGYITARILNNTPLASTTNWRKMELTASASSADGKTQVFAVPMTHQDYFLGQLPAGEYAIRQFSDFFPGADVVHYAPAPASLGTFRIVPGRVTDLGVLIYQPLDSGRRGGPFYIVRDQDDLDMLQLIDTHYPQLTANIATDRVFAWQPGELAHHNDSGKTLLDVSLQYPQINRPELTETQAGQLLTTTKLGVILLRGRTGDWQTVDTGHRLELGDLIELPSGGYLVTAGHGNLLYSHNLPGPWQRLEPPLPGAHLDRLINAGKSGVYLLSHRNRFKEAGWFLGTDIVERNYQLHHAVNPLAGPWQLLDLPAAITSVHGVFSDQKHLYINVNGRKAWQMDLASGDWREISTPLDQFKLNADGAQFSFNSNYQDMPKVLVARNDADSDWFQFGIYLDAIPVRDASGNWYMQGRRVIKLAEGSRKTIPDHRSAIFVRRPNAVELLEIGPGLDRCDAHWIFGDQLTLSWRQNALWASCPALGTLYRYDSNSVNWVKEYPRPVSDAQQSNDGAATKT
ncbi:MAG: hypothetical protein Tsb002_08200 [Wenzhouxiangellaceae bacterium]